MKIIAALISVIILSGIAYSLGYSKGGKDFALLDHVAIGKLSHIEMARCEVNDDPASCYRWNLESNINHSFVFYSQHNYNLSPLAPFVFEESYETYIRSVNYLGKFLQEDGVKAACKHLKSLGDKAISECEEEANEFINLAKYGSNN